MESSVIPPRRELFSSSYALIKYQEPLIFSIESGAYDLYRLTQEVIKLYLEDTLAVLQLIKSYRGILDVTRMPRWL